ncbi:PhzF family isomerase [Patescibacteria group bacterium]|nr:PhzF family isomerase [Patescibacteria group bacterium]
MKKYNLYQIDSFTTEKFTGNPAGVITNAEGLKESDMQMIAREMNNSETAFIFPSNAADHDVQVRFFTPRTEVPMCGHATIAAHYARAIENNLPTTRIIQKVKAGNLPVDIIREDNDYEIVMTQGEIEFATPFGKDITDKICEALKITPDDLLENVPVQIVSTGHSKIMICIKSYGKLKNIEPDYAKLTDISQEVGCNGYFVFTKDTPDPKYFINARMFGPAMGINEDPVNGSSGGALGAYLIKHQLISSEKNQLKFKVRQGFSVGRAGLVEVIMDLDKNGQPLLGKIMGKAVIVFKTTIQI